MGRKTDNQKGASRNQSDANKTGSKGIKSNAQLSGKGKR